MGIGEKYKKNFHVLMYAPAQVKSCRLKANILRL